MDIRLSDHRTHYHGIQTEVLEAVHRVLDAHSLSSGDEGAAFEHAFATLLGDGNVCVGTGSCTDALSLILHAVGIGLGDDVVTVANASLRVVSAIRSVGARPVFCDVDPDTGLIDADLLPSCLTQATRAVIPVHLHGNAADVPRIRQTVAGRGVTVVEDCGDATGAELHGAQVGTLGDAAAFSFAPDRILGAYGAAGLCATRDAKLADALRSVRCYGLEADAALREGVYAPLDELQAAILSVKLGTLGQDLARRRELAGLYDAELAEVVVPMRHGAGATPAYQRYVVRSPKRDAIHDALAGHGIATGIHFRTPVHRMPGYAFLGYPVGSLPATERLAEEILSLPIHATLTPDDVLAICSAVRAAAGS
ncbi:MAG: DegT/DnrJ/EryC1/StrS family aminotransferase [Planctomycetes bacterium]|nr:DegT/DnrJ/EryC1/StrS family aminotransferase [Planctomycetota bacterium]